MADYTKTSETIERIAFRLGTPTNASELDKMIHAAAREYAQATGCLPAGIPDDVLQVTLEDGGIVIWWESQLKGEQKTLA